VSEARGTAKQELESLLESGRRLVRASASLPREAAGFLGRPLRGRHRRPGQGAVPGEMVLPHDAPEPVLSFMSYAGDELEEGGIAGLPALREILSAAGRTVWIDVEGFGNRSLLEALRELLGIHPLAMADLVHAQRPKAELFGDRLLVITQMARVTGDGEIVVEQVGLVLGPGWVASFQEGPGDVFDPVRSRIRAATSRIRQQGADYLLTALIDAVIDGYFPVVEALGGVVDALEEEVIEHPSTASLARIHATRRTLLALHRVQWRQRDAIHGMVRDEDLPFTEAVKPYLRDAHDHAFQTLDAIETHRDLVVGLMDLYLSSASHRLNEVMKTLTIVATLFIPMSFVAGVYGMNFDYMPELHWHWSYPVFWGSMVGLGVGFLLWFRHRGWLGGAETGGD
jgi:magnesium transporter